MNDSEKAANRYMHTVPASAATLHDQYTMAAITGLCNVVGEGDIQMYKYSESLFNGIVGAARLIATKL